MEQDSGSEPNYHPGPVDKTRVLDVKPLNWFTPSFPNPPGTSSVAPHASPFSCFPPSGPFPPGVRPFYPFLISSDSLHAAHGTQNFGGTIPAPVPLNSFRTPTPQGRRRRSRPQESNEPGDVIVDDEGYNSVQSGISPHATQVDSDGNLGSQSGRRRKKLARHVEELDVESLVLSILMFFKLTEFDEFTKLNGNKDTVRTILLVFNLLRRRLTLLEEANKLSMGTTKRPDLKAGTLLMTKGIRTNAAKRVGHVPGIEIGDIFFFRMELCVVGLHAPTMAGIDYLSLKVTVDEEPMAVSIVSSGGYDDVGDDTDVLIYSGQGGVQRPDRQMFDQKLERGNLALEKSLHRANDVRVIRGVKDSLSTGKIYIYDGLYKIRESWAEKNKSGLNVFKYKLVRVPGQAEAYSLWKSIQMWKAGSATPRGYILPDITSHVESQPVTLVNSVDGEKELNHFTYIPTLRYTKPFLASTPSSGCQCLGGCQAGDTNCPCNQRNNGTPPYSSLGVLLTNKSVIYECGKSCACPPNCRNRTSQAGIKIRLEVFKTKNRGWGLRSWDPIRVGAFICEFAGDVINASGDYLSENDDYYVFDATRRYDPLEVVHDESTGSGKAPFPLVISAKNNGNVARFLNHSCLPNVYWQPVLRESDCDSYLHVAFFAFRHIPPLQELTFDYGTVLTGKSDEGKKKCLCGSDKCRGYFY